MQAPPRVQLRSITTYFPENDVTANDAVDMDIEAGTIHALVGENGAGKSTLMHVLSGFTASSAGRIMVDGRTVQLNAPADALTRGIVMVHQHPAYVPGFRVWENVLLGIECTGPAKLLDRSAAVTLIAQTAARYGVSIDPNARMQRLAASQIHFVALLGALLRRPRVLILDEPTAPCTEPEVALMFSLLRSLKSEGTAIVLITHKLKEVMEIADRVTVMRAGAVVGCMSLCDTSAAQIAALMIGEDCQVGDFDRRLVEALAGAPHGGNTNAGAVAGTGSSAAGTASARRSRSPHARDTTLELHKVTVYVGDLAVLDDISLSAQAGEVLGVTGIRENGLEFLEDVLSGSITPDRGVVLLDGKPVKRYSPRHFRHIGISYIPTDRILRGASMDSTVAENLILLHRKELQTGGVLRRKDVAAFAEELKQRYGITGVLHQPMKRLSGGNIQKVILSRELSGLRKVVVFSEPSWGLDLRSRDLMYSEMRALRDEGAVVILISADIDEVLGLSDRIAVMYRGRIAGLLQAEQRTRERIGEFMLGFKERDITALETRGSQDG
ncbi:MAG: ATP-binding cassette domain-containing protein [Spirochaetaceae bacterium]|nr:MAG: ATP-binding cassette domain-containing protein [Spirochaetaceae bacterium]